MESVRPDAREAAERASSARRRICHRRLALEAPREGADDCGGAGGGDGEGEEDPMGRMPEMTVFAGPRHPSDRLVNMPLGRLIFHSQTKS
jgi:hypothetical protein